MKNKLAETDDNIDELFKFQNIASDEFNGLDGIIENYAQCGLRIAVYEAYFWGTVNGKRTERRRIKTRLVHPEV